MNYRFTIVTLSELLAVTRDGEQGFGTCAEHTRDERLKKIFLGRASRRAAFAAQLRDLIGQLSENPGAVGTEAGVNGAILGGARRGWINLRSALALNDDEALVDQCEHGGDHALEVYRNALDDHLPDFVRRVVLRQFEDLMDDHEQIRGLHNEPPRGGIGVASAGGHARP